MRRKDVLTVLASGTFLAATASVASAKKVICVDGCNTPYVNNHEGWARDQMVAGDVIQVGGSLADCLAMLANGDQLIIIAHGSGVGTGFTWGGMTYTGFGNGANQGTNPYPVPAGFGMLMNITVDFCSCWSDRDPDGPTGNDRSLTDKIEDALGAGANANGFNDLATARVNYTVQGGTQARVDAALMCLENDTSWMSNPPANRPNTGGMAQPPNQKSAAEAIVDACPGAGGANNVTVTSMTYKAPTNEVAAPAGGGVGGCECPNSPPFCGFGTSEGHPLFAFPFCFGEGCPCGNNFPGAGCLNSSGTGAFLFAMGSSSVLQDDLVLVTEGCPPNNTGLYFMGANQFPPIFVGDGLGCTGGLFRFFPGVVDPAGNFVLQNPVAQAPAGFIQPGDLRFFQSWTRDVLCGPPPAPCPSPCNQNSNLSSGLGVGFTP